ncbi:MAG: bifunctional diaminohydroxyphosphoribosylaminopyrimidine deaminase/5-amino-6-(5-phosphoribosylamino)uracil reductase RibD [Candidatus Peribacteraceae bacterium]
MRDAGFIRRCLDLARMGQGETGINPLVGAVLVRDGKIIAEAFHSGFGKPHAERQLLQNFDQKIDSKDTLYVNLEPCCHKQKKTPQCVQYIIDRGVKKLVFGMIDPNPMVAGKGIAALRNAGIEVIGPVLPEECRRLNRGFVSLMTKGRPWITIHRAQTRDGRITNSDGPPLKITSFDQDSWAHTFLRARHDAILVGVGTILSDDPQLNVRYNHWYESQSNTLRQGFGGQELWTPFSDAEHQGIGLLPSQADTQHLSSSSRRSPAGRRRMDDPPDIFRIVLDAGLRIPLKARVVNPPLACRTMVVTKGTEGIKEIKEFKDKRKLLEGRGVRIIDMPFSPSPRLAGLATPLPMGEGMGMRVRERGGFDWQILWSKLTTPDGNYHGITSILVEGGLKTWEAFHRAGLVDEEVTMVGG